jgi:hypothetical protein
MIYGEKVWSLLPQFFLMKHSLFRAYIQPSYSTKCAIFYLRHFGAEFMANYISGRFSLVSVLLVKIEDMFFSILPPFKHFDRPWKKLLVTLPMSMRMSAMVCRLFNFYLIKLIHLFVPKIYKCVKFQCQCNYYNSNNIPNAFTNLCLRLQIWFSMKLRAHFKSAI